MFYAPWMARKHKDNARKRLAPNGRVYANIGRASASPMLAEAARIPARSEARGKKD
jgi:hypothetical protein